MAEIDEWHTFIEDFDCENNLNLQILKEGIDDRVRAIAQIDKRLADLYLRCKLKK